MTDVSNADESTTGTAALDANSETYRAHYHEASEISTTVVLTVAAARDEDAAALPPLNDVVDPDALNRMFAPRIDGSPRESGRIQFTLADCVVTVTGDGEITVAPP